MLRIFAAGLLLGAALGCAGDTDCVEGLPADCAPEYPATFEQVHARTLAPSCAVAGGACHAADGKQGGLDLSDVEGAFLALTQAPATSASGARVVPGDAACSLLVRRIESARLDEVMPPGAPLREGVRCAIRTWIDEGAPR